MPLSAVAPLFLSTSPNTPLHFTVPCPHLVVFQSLTFIVLLPSSLSFFPPPDFLYHHSVLLPLHHVLTLTHLSFLHSCSSKCLFICLNRVCLFGDRSGYILIKTRQRQDKHQTACKWSWQGRKCYSYFTVLCRCTPHGLILTVFLFIFASHKYTPHTNIHCVWGFDIRGS